jgi:DNA-directed RNA polymerase specialized sigma24 family protein
VLEAAQGRGEGGPEALARLWERYWPPLYAFARHRGFSPEDAQGLVHGFFEHLIESRTLGAVNQAKGRFRSFLLASFQNFAAIERNRLNSRPGISSTPRERSPFLVYDLAAESVAYSAIDPCTAAAIATPVDPSPTATATVYPPAAATATTVYPSSSATATAVNPTSSVGLGRRCKPGAPKNRRRNRRAGPLPHALKKKAPV